MLDDSIKYWLCCGSKSAQHDYLRCHESRQHPEHCRYGTAREHSEWQLKEKGK